MVVAPAEVETPARGQRQGLNLLPRTVRGILILLIVAMAAPILVVETGLHYGRLSQQRERETQTNLELARAMAEYLDAFVHDVVRQELFLGVALSSPDRSMSEGEARWLLSSSAGERPEVGYFAWLDAVGRVLSSSDPRSVGTNLSDRICFDQTGGGDWCVTDPLPSDEGPVFYVAKAIHYLEARERGLEQAARHDGFIVASVDPAWLGHALGIERFGKGAVVLVDRAGRVAYGYPPNGLKVRSELAEAPLVVKALGGEEAAGSFFPQAGGAEYLAGFVPVRSAGWAVGAYRPGQLVWDAAIEEYLEEIGTYVLVTAFAVLLTLIISSGLTAPMRRLRDHALAIGRGELGRRISVDKPLELVTLAAAFNLMAKEIEVRQEEEQAYVAEIEEAQEELRAARDELEDRVKERTAELAASEERFRSVMETAVNAIILVDQRGTVLFWNRAATRLFGYTDAEMVGETLAPVIPRRLWEDYRTGVSRMLAGERSVSVAGAIEVVGRRKDGSEFPAELSIGTTKTGEETLFTSIVRDLTRRKQADENLRQSLVALRRALEQTVQAMAMTVETRDPYTAGHQRRVADLADSIARKMGLSEEQDSVVKLAATIHDIGKISVPAEILVKPGKITDWEFDLIKGHPRIGYDILKNIDFPWPIARIVHEHHERLDGSGYPAGLSGAGILLEAKIVAVADVVEAMASNRPYRPAVGVQEALQEIAQNAGLLYDADVVEACLRVFEDGFVWA